MKLWVTRPSFDAEILSTILVTHGHEVVIESLLNINFKDIGVLNLENIQALIVTSRNGIRAAIAAKQADLFISIPLFTVGAGTAALAKALGFQNVIEGPSNAKSLLAVIQAHTVSDKGMLLHLASETLAFDLTYYLRKLGYRAICKHVYTARPVRLLSPNLLSQITIGVIDGVILLSPRTAQVYANLLEFHNVKVNAQNIIHFCLSQAVADRLLVLKVDKICIPWKPNINELLKLISNKAHQAI